MMVRTQIMLEEQLRRRARDRASELGISLAEYIRRLLAQDLGALERGSDPAAVFDLGESDGSNVAARKDAMVGDATSRSGRP